MKLKNRLTKLERMANPVVAPLFMIPSADNSWTPEQEIQMKEAEAQGRMILRVNFIAPGDHVSD